MCILFRRKALSDLYLRARASLSNSVKPENNFLKTYSLMTYLGFDLKYLKERGEGGERGDASVAGSQQWRRTGDGCAGSLC